MCEHVFWHLQLLGSTVCALLQDIRLFQYPVYIAPQNLRKSQSVRSTGRCVLSPHRISQSHNPLPLSSLTVTVAPPLNPPPLLPGQATNPSRGERERGRETKKLTMVSPETGRKAGATRSRRADEVEVEAGRRGQGRGRGGQTGSPETGREAGGDEAFGARRRRDGIGRGEEAWEGNRVGGRGGPV